MQEKNSISTAIMMILPTLCWGLSFSALKISLETYSPLAVVSIRIFFVVLILSAIYFSRYGLKGLPEKKDIPMFLLIGILNPFLAFFLECVALRHISASLASVVSSTIPLMTPIAAFFILKERIGLFNVLGLIVAFCGACFIILGRGSNTDFTLFGLIMMILSVLACVFYAIFARKLLRSYPSLTVFTFQQIFGFVFYIPLFLIMEASFVFNPENYNPRGLLAILFLTIFPSCIAYGLFNEGIKKIGPSRASAFINFTPVVAAVASYFILKENLNTMKIIGILLAVSGLFLSQVSDRKKIKTGA